MSLLPIEAAANSSLTLIFDADDTLWENNVLFERVIDDYLDWVAHPTLQRSEIRRMLDDVEAANVVSHGYGSSAFLHNLGECLELLRQRPASASEQEQIAGLATALIEHRIELMPGVVEALQDLGQRHELLLLTKGERAEQQRKIDASGLAANFSSIHIVPEKNVRTYRQLTSDLGLNVDRSWMVGNSPKSDILPARAAGMQAVYIPHEHTWVLEHSELDPSDSGVLTLRSFPDLLLHF